MVEARLDDGQHLVAIQAGAWIVRPEHVHQRQRVRGRRHVGGVECGDLGGIVDDRFQLLRHDRAKLRRSLGYEPNFLRFELLQDARGGLPTHGQQQRCDLLRSAQPSNNSLHGGSYSAVEKA